MTMRSIQRIFPILGAALLLAGCRGEPKYGVETALKWPGATGGVWAVAPVVNLSGEPGVDPLLQADLLFQQLQQVRGLTVIPVNRVVEIYTALRIQKVQTPEQAALVCELLRCDALVVPTVTLWDPYNPPKLGAAIQVLPRQTSAGAPALDPHEMVRAAAPLAPSVAAAPRMIQAVGMYDAANGSVREALWKYVVGRNDPVGPLGPREYVLNMDRYCGFVYHELIVELLGRSAPVDAAKAAGFTPASSRTDERR